MAAEALAPLVSGLADRDELVRIREWRESLAPEQFARAVRVPLDSVAGWETAAGLAAFRHHSSKFFSVVGIEVRSTEPGATWMQPMIDQPEIGLLGIAITPTERGWAALIQAKAEPGSINGIQLSPTVQATRSNSTRVHQGRPVPYLDLFARPDRVLVDTRQSEHGAVFWRKRNRVVVVQIAPQVPLPSFRWVELADLLGLLRDDDLVHADTRAVLACLPWTIAEDHARRRSHEQLWASLPPDPSGESMRRLGRWMSAERSGQVLTVRPVPLPDLQGWQRAEYALAPADRQSFEIVAVDVQACGREVDRWSQPMVHPRGVGLIGLATTTRDDQVMVLLRMCTEPGLVDGAELGPTVQLADGTEPRSADEQAMADLVTSRPESDRLFDAVLSDEGGRFLHGRHRHLIVRVEDFEPPAHYRWCRPAELIELLVHSHQVNMQARSAYLCLLATTCEELRRG